MLFNIIIIYVSDPMYYPFLGDEFLRLMILRYVFCESVLRMHRSFRARTNLPRAYPPLPDDLFEHRDLVAIVIQMADYIGVSFMLMLLLKLKKKPKTSLYNIKQTI